MLYVRDSIEINIYWKIEGKQISQNLEQLSTFFKKKGKTDFPELENSKNIQCISYKRPKK